VNNLTFCDAPLQVFNNGCTLQNGYVLLTVEVSCRITLIKGYYRTDFYRGNMIYHIGQTDPYGYTKRRQRGPVEMWETPSGNFVVYLSATDEHVLHGFRKYREDADALFDSVCLVLPHLELE